MEDYYKTIQLALKGHWIDYIKPSSYNVTYRLKDVNDLKYLKSDYDLFILDRDCTLQKYHGKTRVPEFEDTLHAIKDKSEIASNSSFEELLRIRDVYGDLMPVSKLVKSPHQWPDGCESEKMLLRFDKGNLQVWTINNGNYDFAVDETSTYAQGDKLLFKITGEYRKPDPKVIESIALVNTTTKRIAKGPKILMVGDRFLTDILAGNLAGVDTARVEPYGMLSERHKPVLLAGRVADSAVGNMMNIVYEMFADLK